MKSTVLQILEESLKVHEAIFEIQDRIEAAGLLLAKAYRQGHKALFFGNGGSAADAQHLAGEMNCRFLMDRGPLPGLALHANTSSLTAVGNDYGYELVFARLLEAHSQPGDVALAISTSGTSPNILRAAERKEELGLSLIALTGQEDNPLARLADVWIPVPSKSTPRIQEGHILIGHILCAWVEKAMFEDPKRA
ncbi:MAG: SIS domain-containing protein [Deltaproteobacteria bacterium]|nr:SIS domain-containing protein [Deltaproteobacteria bacterium]